MNQDTVVDKDFITDGIRFARQNFSSVVFTCLCFSFIIIIK